LEQSTLPLSLNDFSVLPDNRSKLERGLELSFAQHVYGIIPPFPNLLDGNKTPVESLPYLALDRQVSEWREDYTEDIKRQLTDSSWRVKRLSGTVEGIRLALNTLNFDAIITPWHQQTPQGQPYNLDVVAFSQNNQSVDPQDALRIESYLNEVKSERDVINLALTFGVESFFSINMASAPPTNVVHLEQKAVLPPLDLVPIGLTLNTATAPVINVQHLTLKGTL
jgi:phage tail P2-like protein